MIRSLTYRHAAITLTLVGTLVLGTGNAVAGMFSKRGGATALAPAASINSLTPIQRFWNRSQKQDRGCVGPC